MLMVIEYQARMDWEDKLYKHEFTFLTSELSNILAIFDDKGMERFMLQLTTGRTITITREGFENSEDNNNGYWGFYTISKNNFDKGGLMALYTTLIQFLIKRGE